MTYRHLFFDMDGTVTLSRRTIKEDMKTFLQSLPHTISIISGSHNQQIASQMDGVPVIRMGQSGNHTIALDGTELWYEKLTQEEKHDIIRHINTIQAACTHTVPDQSDLIEDRGSQISFSLYGHHADPVVKKAFDGDFAKRTALLTRYPFHSNTLEVKMGGSTCFDYFRKGRHKGFNISRIIEHHNWQANECLFFGDALFAGGNDESVIGVIETVSVTDPEDCLRQLQQLL